MGDSTPQDCGGGTNDSGGTEDLADEDLGSVSTSFVSPDHTGQLIQNIEMLRLTTGYTDLTISIENQKFPCHKIILAAGSPYFRTMFASGMEESRKEEIEIKQIEAAVFQRVLRFIYTGCVEISGNNVQELFMQAQLFQIEQLVELCVTFFQDCMQESNCLAAMTLADTHGHAAMYEFAKNYACQHFSTVVEDDDFLRLSVECITDLLHDRRISCTTEEQVYEAAVRWLEHEPRRKQQHAYAVLRCIKFPLVNLSYLMDTVSAAGYLNCDEGRELMDTAIMHHTVPSRRHMLPSYQWEDCAKLVTAVENMGFVAYGKKIYLFGGKNSEEVVTNLVQCFDTATRTCSLCTNCLPANDMCVSAAVLNRRIYVVGLEGFFGYQPNEDKWDVLTDMLLPRDFVSLCVLDEKLYAFGGRRRGAKDNLYSDSIEVYDPLTGTWSNAGHTPVPMYSYGCVRVFLSGPLKNKRQSFYAASGTDGTTRADARAQLSS